MGVPISQPANHDRNADESWTLNAGLLAPVLVGVIAFIFWAFATANAAVFGEGVLAEASPNRVFSLFGVAAAASLEGTARCEASPPMDALLLPVLSRCGVPVAEAGLWMSDGTDTGKPGPGSSTGDKFCDARLAAVPMGTAPAGRGATAA